MNEEKVIQKNEKDLVVKLDSTSRILAQSVLDQANKGKQFKKKLTFKDVFDHLLKTYGEKSVPSLMKMREQPEDKLKLRYQNSGSSLEYHVWLEEQLSKLDEVKKKSSKKKRLEENGAN